MVILRATKKLSSLLPAAASVPACGDNALGDWYVNRIVVERKPLLLLVSASSLLPILVPARDVRSLPGRLSDLVAARLRRCGLEDATIEAEVSAMAPVIVGPTVDRSVLGTMVDFAKMAPYYLCPGPGQVASLEDVEDRLAETPCRATRSFDQVIFPRRKAADLLRAKWLLEPGSGPSS
jgi:hypothetical protein